MIYSGVVVKSSKTMSPACAETIALLNKHCHFELAGAVRIGFMSEAEALRRSGLLNKSDRPVE